MELKHLLLLLFLANTALLFAQPDNFDQMFHPQTEDEIAVMKKSAQKTVALYFESIYAADTGKVLNKLKKYDDEGRLTYNQDYSNHITISYAYDKKGRVVEYKEDNKAQSQLLHFTVTYSKRGAIEGVVNRAERGKSVSYNANTKTLLISDMGGFIYRYTLNDDNQLVKVALEYYQSRPYTAELMYNKKGQLETIKGTREEGEDMINFVTSYTYIGKLLSQEEENKTIPYFNNTKKSRTTAYTYANGLLSRKVKTTPEETTVYELFYDENERITQMNYLENEMLTATLYYEYR